MIAALDYYYYQDESDSNQLLPTDPVGQDFFRIFKPHLWDFLYGYITKEGSAKWYKESRYPIEPRILWNMYKNPKKLVGLSFGEETRKIVLDIDWYSPYHPRSNEYLFKEILHTLEDIGLCRPIVIQSSSSGGIHVYYFLPYPIHSYTLAAAIAQHLSNVGFWLEDGDLEMFPNPKRWSETPTAFKAIRAPLQAGSFVLDRFFQALHSDIALFLEEAELTATLQDMDLLVDSLGLAQDWSERQFRRKWETSKMSGVQYKSHLEAIMREGWTGFGQTNEILKKVATYGVIFKHLSGQALADYIEAKAQTLPNYHIFCRHTHEIDQRAKDLSKWAAGFPYLPYAESPVRDITYKEYNEIFFGRGKNNNSSNNSNANSSNVIPFPKNKYHERTMEKLSTVIGVLQQSGTYPDMTTARGKAIIAKSIEIYGEGISPNTLRKKGYREYWHPLYIVLEESSQAQAGVTACPELVAAFVLPDVWDELESQETREPLLGEYLSDWERYWWNREWKSRQSKGLSELQQNSIYEGILALAPSQSASVETNNYNSQELGFENSAPAEGERGYERVRNATELELEIPQTQDNLTNQSQDQVTLILISLILIQTVSILINSTLTPDLINNSISNSTPSNSEVPNVNSLSKEFNVNIHESLSTIISDFISELVNQFINSNSSNNCSNSVIEVNSVIGINARTCTIYDSTVFWHLLSRHVLLNPNLQVQGQVIDFIQGLYEGTDSASSSQLNSSTSQQLEGAGEACSNQQEEVLEQHQSSGASSNSGQAQASGQITQGVENINPPTIEIAPKQWKQQHERMQVQRKARNHVQDFCRGLRTKPDQWQQECMKNILHNCLLLKSSMQGLQDEARAWFASSSEIVSQLTGFEAFWAYMDKLQLEIPF